VRMRWAGHVVHTWGMKDAYKILIGKLKGKRPLRDIGIDGKVNLSLYLTKHHAMKTYWGVEV